ncbi:MAG: hypothetical protein IK132_07275 [Clostridia bacterium]|nr:hypothetical protein [Clostridia bacterium]
MKAKTAEERLDGMIRAALLELAGERWHRIEALDVSDVRISARHDRRMRKLFAGSGSAGNAKKLRRKGIAAAACLCLIAAGVFLWAKAQREAAPHEMTLYYNEVISESMEAPLYAPEIEVKNIDLGEASVLLDCDFGRCIPAAMKAYACKCYKVENTETDEIWNVIVDIREDHESDTAPGLRLDASLNGKPSTVDYTYDAEAVYTDVGGIEVYASVIPASTYTTASGRERTVPGVYIAEFEEGGTRYYIESRGTMEQIVFDEFVCDMIIKGLKRSAGNPLEADDLTERERADILDDFAVPDFSGAALSGNALPEDAAPTEESFTDPKTALFSRMLNTVDRFDRLFLSLETNMIGGTVREIDFQIDLSGGRSCQVVREAGTTVSETFSDQETGMVTVDHGEKLCVGNYLPVYAREEAPYIPLAERIKVMEDGIPVYVYRNNITNCPLASYAVFPQEIAFSYLKDFDDWEIEGTGETYLGRRCAVLRGTPSPYLASKHGIDSFRMTVDEETGILLELYGTKDGGTVIYTAVSAIDLDPAEDVARFDESLYAGYRTENR